MKLGEAMYKASQEAEAAEQPAPDEGAGASASQEDSGDSTVVDADFEEVDPEKDKKDS